MSFPKDVLRQEYYLLRMWYNIFIGTDFWCFVGGGVH